MKNVPLKSLMNEGAYGPGTRKQLLNSNPSWTIWLNAIENKKRPEALFITMSTWVKPQLSVSKSMTDLDAETVALNAAKDFDRGLRYLGGKIKNFFDSLYFDPSSVIYVYDFSASRAAPGKTQFLEIEINIDTVNYIDDNDNPSPNLTTGKVEHIHFNDFVKPAQDAVKAILNMDIIKKQKDVTFHKTKAGK